MKVSKALFTVVAIVYFYLNFIGFEIYRIFFPNYLGSLCLTAKTFWRLAKVAISTTNVDAENQTLINHKCVCGALNRHFCQTPVALNLR
jgi:hypothetical protein